MNERTKYLLIAMGIVAAFYFGDMGYRNWVEGPAEARQRDLRRVEKSLGEAKKNIIDTAGAVDQLELLERISLPYDPELARAAYQDWLLDLVQQSKLTGASVDASQPSSVKIKDRDTKRPKEIFLRYTFALRARGSLQQVSQFLYDFYQGGHLHKINAISFNPVGGGREVDFNATIEALGLTRCERKAELSKEHFRRLASQEFDDYQLIARRNLFARHGDATLGKIVLTAVTISGGASQAWFKDDKGESKVLGRGETLEVAAHTIQIVDIVGESVLLDVDGRVIAITAGQSVRDVDQQ